MNWRKASGCSCLRRRHARSLPRPDELAGRRLVARPPSPPRASQRRQFSLTCKSLVALVASAAGHSYYNVTDRSRAYLCLERGDGSQASKPLVGSRLHHLQVTLPLFLFHFHVSILPSTEARPQRERSRPTTDGCPDTPTTSKIESRGNYLRGTPAPWQSTFAIPLHRSTSRAT